jgi:hypothetical protein
LPRLGDDGEPVSQFWVAVDQHILTVDGSTKVLVCPDDHDSRDEGVCPLCTLSRELYRSGEPGYLETAKELSTRRRVYVNAVAVEEIDDHVANEWVYVWAFSQTVLTGIMDICVAKGAFIDDLVSGRNVILTCKRIGSQKRDVRYSVTDKDPSTLDEAQAAVFMGNLNSLEDLSSAATIEDLSDIRAVMDPRPGGKRSSHVVAGPAPSAPAPAPAPPKAPAPAPTGGVYHYSGSAGDHDPMDAESVARIVAQNPGDHHVWQEGMDGWSPAGEIAEIAVHIQRLSAPEEPAAAVPPPPQAPPVGPPKPPKPPGGAAF